MKFISFMESFINYFVCFITLTFKCQFVTLEIILENPIKTNFGKWGKEERCPLGTFVAGFQLKTQAKMTFGDNTALNAVRLYCQKLGETDFPKVISSTEGSRGKWGVLFRCNEGLFTGFQLRSEENRGPILDDSAAQNLRMLCSSSKNYTEGDGLDGGQWTKEQHCFERQAICGIQTQVEDADSKDLTGLNNCRMICCDIPNPAQACIPKDEWVVIQECDNTKSNSTFECKYTHKIGVGSSSASSSSESNSLKSLSSLGFNVKNMIQGLELNFKSKLSNSDKTGFKWGSSNTNTWNSQTTKSFEFIVPPQQKSVVSQIVGTCEQFSVHTTAIKKVDTNAQGDKIT